MNDNGVGVRPLLLDMSSNLLKHLQGHRLIGLIFQKSNWSALGLLSYCATHDHDRTIAGMIR
jgi:hypothetical protein